MKKQVAINVIALMLWGCEPSNLSPIPSLGPNMSAITSSSLEIGKSGSQTDRSIALVGFDGAVEPNASIRVAHERLGQIHETTASATGSFAFHLEVRTGDTLLLTVQIGDSDESAPVTMEVPAADLGIDRLPFPEDCEGNPHMEMEWTEEGVCSMAADSCFLGTGFDMVAANLRTGDVQLIPLNAQGELYGQMGAELGDQFLVFGQHQSDAGLTTEVHLMDAPPAETSNPEQPGS
jgi:hypothetical protein